jgi:hypothetical protein
VRKVVEPPEVISHAPVPEGGELEQGRAVVAHPQAAGRAGGGSRDVDHMIGTREGEAAAQGLRVLEIAGRGRFDSPEDFPPRGVQGVLRQHLQHSGELANDLQQLVRGVPEVEQRQEAQDLLLAEQQA